MLAGAADELFECTAGEFGDGDAFPLGQILGGAQFVGGQSEEDAGGVLAGTGEGGSASDCVKM